jgi:16S rRNA (cytosine1402-N4)-methyltransferase
MERLHRSIMLKEVIEFLQVRSGGSYADLTFGEGGHSEEILTQSVTEVMAIDRDLSALELYKKEGKYAGDPRLTLVHGRNSLLAEVLDGKKLDGILADLGVSTKQLLKPERGFSFQSAGPLDMRMNPTDDESLADLLNRVDAEELANMIYANAEIKTSRSLARKILDRWRKGELKTTLDLAALMPKIPGKVSHPATALFLGLRMAVNDEKKEVSDGIRSWVECLKPGGRLVVITFHSVEDRVVKHEFAKLSGKCICKRQPCSCPREERVKLLTPKPVEPSEEELRSNPRARSAKLRAVEKI